MNMTRLARTNKMRTNIALLLTGLLMGCGGGEEGSSHAPSLPPTPVGRVFVVDGFGAVRPNSATRVDLSAFIRGQGATLAAINSVQPECRASNLSGLTAEVTIEDGGLCNFTFTASNSVSDASASLRVLASTNATPILPPISQTLTTGSGDTQFDLQTLHATEWPLGYMLDRSSLQVQGGSVQGTLSGSYGNRIIYRPPASPDWNRIIFILKNPSRPNEDVFGSLYVTVSDSVNQAPMIGKPKYDYTVDGGGNILSFENRTIDLSTLPKLNIQDPEGQAWQLIEVQSYSASVIPVDPTSVTNKKFIFSAGTIGEHIVSYIVGDHQGGFTMGLIKINVNSKEYTKDWQDITVQPDGITFFATPLYSESAEKGVAAEGIWDSGVNLTSSPVGNTIAGVDSSGAASYCSNHRLPTKADLELLRNSRDSTVISSLAKYPKQRKYIYIHNNPWGAVTKLAYNFLDGQVEEIPTSSPKNYYVMCVKYPNDGLMKFTPVIDTFVGTQSAPWTPVGTLISDGGAFLASVGGISAGSEPLSVENLRLNPIGCSGGECVVEVSATSNQWGAIMMKLRNVKNTNQQITHQVTVQQNVTLVTANTVKNNAIGNGVDKNIIKLTFQDKYGNPVPQDTKVKVEVQLNPYDEGDYILFPPYYENKFINFTVDENSQSTIEMTCQPKGNSFCGSIMLIIKIHNLGLSPETFMPMMKFSPIN